jgi:hypothetical protein
MMNFLDESKVWAKDAVLEVKMKHFTELLSKLKI